MRMKRLLLALCLAGTAAACTEPKDTMEYANTWEITPQDTEADILALVDGVRACMTELAR